MFAIQVAMSAALVPPSTFGQARTMSRVRIVVLVFGAELHADVIGHGVT